MVFMPAAKVIRYHVNIALNLLAKPFVKAVVHTTADDHIHFH